MVRGVAEKSAFAEQIGELVTALEFAPDDRYLAACSGLAGLLGNIEWPPALDQARVGWLDALDSLLYQMACRRGGTLAEKLRGHLDTPARQRWFAVLESTHRVISVPCLLPELPHLARICNAALESYLEAMNEALAQAPDTGALNDARVAFMYAHSRYADSVRLFNQRVGAVLFYDFSPPFGRSG